MAASKPQSVSEFQEFDTHGPQSNVRTTRVAESARFGLTVLALLAGITIVTTSADTLVVYNNTHLSEDFFLPLWPSDFNIRPTIALVVCSAIVVLVSAISIFVSKVSALRSKAPINGTISFLAPTAGLIAAIIATSFFYGVNASTTTDSLQSWSCTWSSITMDTQPHFGTLCSESKVALYLTVMLIPVEVLVLGTAAWTVFAEKKQAFVHERKGSPAMS